MSAPLPAYCTALLSWKSDSGITFAEIAAQLGKPEVWTTALFFGQAKTDDETARKLLAITQTDYNDTLKYYTIDDPTVKHCPGWAVVHGLSGKGVDSRGVDGMVTRGGTWEWPPKDPVIYRLYEVLVVYGSSYKALIAEKFGDGIMSAIGFRTSLEKKRDETGDRVVITLDGKFLPYSNTDQWDMSLSK
ncbi:cyanate lyase C-terminal domain-containing protein [Papiliotrema laurentii]|uniref:Cyanate hydratase n=1 Tax=Papiliotrema laurentii TaxID=5418 RepID=A0AAD9FUN4_PAPLA|nr:cyanate lyase C-terminal domain-containing protein [Papiliotrema laurentii]